MACTPSRALDRRAMMVGRWV